MGVRFEVVQSAAPTSSGTQDFVFSGFGTPKAAILIFSNVSISGTDISDAVIGVGITDGVRQFATCGISQNGVGTANTFSQITDSGCILLLESSVGGIDGEASFDSWVTDGLRINWSDPPTSGILVTAVLINGTDLSAYVGDFTSSATIGNSVDVIAPNFEPDQLIILAAGPLTSYNTSLSDMYVSLGFVDNGVSVVQCSANEFANDGASLGDTRNNISSIYAPSLVISSDIEISDFDNQGFSAFTRTVAGGFKYPYLALAYSGVVSHWVGIIDSPTATGLQSVVSPGIKPQFVLHCPNAVATIDGDRTTDSTGAGTFSIGVFTDTDAFTTSIEDQDTADPIRSRSSTYSQPVKYDSGAGVNLHSAIFTSFDPSGWTLNYSVANATVRKWPTLVVEESIPVITDNLDLFVSGPIQFSENLDLFINGKNSLASNMDLFIGGKDNINDDLNLFINGKDIETNNLTLYISTIDNISNSIDFFIHGKETQFNNINLFIFNSESINSNCDLFIQGQDLFSKELDLFLSNKVVENDINLFIAGPIIDKVKVEITQVIASPGLQDITIPDFDVVKAAMFIFSNVTTTGIQVSGIEYSMGFTDGIKSRAIGFSSEENLPDSNTQSVGTEDHLIILPEKANNGLSGSAKFEEWIQDGIRINWDTFPSGNYLLTAIFFGGKDLDVLVDTFITPSTTENSVNIDTVFEPDQLIGISNGFVLNESIQNLGRLCVGFADNGDSLNQGSITYFSSDGATIGSPASIISSGIFQRRITLSSVINSVQISGFTSSGFIAETVTSNGSTSVGFLALKYNDNRDHFVGFVDSPVISGVSEFNNPDFHPLVVFQLLTQLENLNNLISFDEAGVHGLSIFTQNEEFSHSFSEKSSTITENHTLFDNTAINFPNQDGLQSFVASYDQMTSSGWKLDFTSVDGSVRKWLVLSVEDPSGIFINNQINLFLKVPELIDGSFTLFITGYKESTFNTLFLKTPDNDIATSRSLHIYGSPSGIDLNFAGQGLDLFVKSSFEDSIYPPITSGYNSLFMGVESGNESSNGYWPLFLKSDTSISNNIDLYISTNERMASGFIDLFIIRIPDFPGQEGFTPINASQTLFLKTLVGEIKNLDLFISGFFATSSNGVNCFIEGVFTINDNLNLVLFGITGFEDNNINLFIDGIDTQTYEISLFIRGH